MRGEEGEDGVIADGGFEDGGADKDKDDVAARGRVRMSKYTAINRAYVNSMPNNESAKTFVRPCRSPKCPHQPSKLIRHED